MYNTWKLIFESSVDSVFGKPFLLSVDGFVFRETPALVEIKQVCDRNESVDRFFSLCDRIERNKQTTYRLRIQGLDISSFLYFPDGSGLFTKIDSGLENKIQHESIEFNDTKTGRRFPGFCVPLLDPALLGFTINLTMFSLTPMIMKTENNICVAEFKTTNNLSALVELERQEKLAKTMQIAERNGYTETFVNDGILWGFPPNGVMPIPVPSL